MIVGDCVDSLNVLTKIKVIKIVFNTIIKAPNKAWSLLFTWYTKL